MTQDAPIEIFGIPQSNFVRAMRMTALEKGIEHVLHPVLPHSPEACSVHPLGLVPGFRHGDVRLGESTAILTYLDRLYATPMGPAGSPYQAAETAQWISIVATTVDRVFIRRYAFAYIFPKTLDGAPDRAAIQAVLPELKATFAMLEDRVSDRSFLAAERFTFADALLLATLDPTLLFPEAMAIEAPALTQYFKRHSARPSFIKTAAD